MHGRHIDDDRTVICQYQGAAKEPSPSREKAENLAAAREAARFKWVTAPGRGVKPGEIEAVWHHGHNRYSGPNIEFIEEQHLLLKNGWAHDRLRVPLADSDVAASRCHEPEHWHEWRKKAMITKSAKTANGKHSKALPCAPPNRAKC